MLSRQKGASKCLSLNRTVNKDPSTQELVLLEKNEKMAAS